MDCTIYLRNMGYIVGPKVSSGCSQGAGIYAHLCPPTLIWAGVRGDHANTACHQASRPA